MRNWLVLLIWFYLPAFGQEVSINPSSTSPVKIDSEFTLAYAHNNDKYVSSRWVKGRLYYANGTSKGYDSLNFDRYANTIEVVINDKPLSVYPMGLVGALIYKNDKTGYIFINAEIDGEQQMMEVLSVGKYILVKNLKVNEVIPSNTIKIDEIRFVPKPENPVSVIEKFYIWDTMKWKQFKLSKSSIGKLFSLDRKSLQTYISEKNISVSNNKSLVLLFQILNNAD